MSRLFKIDSDENDQYQMCKLSIQFKFFFLKPFINQFEHKWPRRRLVKEFPTVR